MLCVIGWLLFGHARYCIAINTSSLCLCLAFAYSIRYPDTESHFVCWPSLSLDFEPRDAAAAAGGAIARYIFCLKI